jgi:hypothetical protein
MTLLKNDGSIPTKTNKIIVNSWPAERLPEGLGLSVKDGWYLGIGFGLAMTIAIPFILLFLSCIIGTGLLIFGSSLGALF